MPILNAMVRDRVHWQEAAAWNETGSRLLVG
jgi:hypothetical protein